MNGVSRGGTPLRLLLVEDSENDAMLLLRELRRGGYEPVYERVYTPEGMRAALEGAIGRGEPYEVVVSDYYMPRFRAPGALELLRGLGHDVPFIVVSGKIGEDAAVEIMKAGANDYLTKENMARLCPAIERGLKEAEVRKERERAEEALARSEERYRTFVTQSSEGIWRFELEEPVPTDLPDDEIIDRFYRHAYLAECNDVMARMYGYGAAEDLVGARAGALLPRTDPDNVAFLKRMIRAGYRLDGGETREIGREGNERVFVNNVTGIVEDGRVVRVWGTQRDVTEQKEAEELLARLASFPELDPNPIVETTLAGEPTYLNPAAQARFPDLRELGGRHPALADLDEVNRRIWSSGGRPFVREVRVGEHLYQQSVSRTLEGGSLRVYGVDVTGRRRAEDSLRESEERFRSLVQNASDIIALVDEEGVILYESPAVERVLGFTPEERTGTSAFGLIHPEDREAVMLMFRDRRDVPGPFPPVEYRIRDRRGEWRHLEAIGENLLHDPAVGGVVVNARDVTDRRRTEEALREAEARYRTLVEELPAATYVQDAVTNRLTYLSPQIGRLLGYTPEEYLADPDLRRTTTHPEDHGWVLAEERRTDGTGEPHTVEYRRIARDGSVVWVRDAAVLVRNEEGDPLYWQGFLTDVTDRRRAEDALRQSEELYRNVVEQAAEGIFLVDVRTMRILEANAALADTLGYSLEEIRGMTLYDVVAHERESVDLNTELVVQEGWRSLGERRYRSKDGTLVDVEVNVSTVPYDGGMAMCIVAHDVTERRRAERALGEIREAERGRIARELHDGVLQDIVYALQEIQVLQITGGHDGEAMEDTADALRRSVEGLRAAIFDLRLDETLGRSFVSSLEALVDLNRRMARGAYEIELVVGDGLPEDLSGGRGRDVVRIVQEALTNARRHAGAGRVRVEVWPEGDDLHAEVSDDGRGFDPEASGVGMGRHSMRQRALDLGGEVRFLSKPGGGTRVLCRIPLSGVIGEVSPGGRGF